MNQEVNRARNRLRMGTQLTLCHREGANRVKLSLTAKIFIGMALGIAAGALIGEAIVPVKVVGNIFIRLISVLTVPFVMTILITGVASLGDPRRLGRIGGKVLLIYEATSVIAIALGLILANLMQPGKAIAGLGGKVNVPASPPATDLIESLFPRNIMDAMARADMIQILVFSILLGVALGIVKHKVPLILQILDQAYEALLAMLKMILWLSPYGVFALMAATTATLGLKVLLPLGIYLVGIAIACLFQIFVVSGLLVWVVARVSPIQFFRYSWDYAMVAFSTQSSAAAFPVELEAANRMGINPQISGFTLPLGQMNQDGTALYQAFATVLIAQFYGVDLSFGQQFVVLVAALLASSGSFAIPGAGLITLSIVLKSAGLPLEGIALVAGVDRVADMFRTTLNVVDDMACTLAVAATEKGGFDRDVFYGRKPAEHTIAESAD